MMMTTKILALAVAVASAMGQESPRLATEDGNMYVRLPRDATMSVERRQTIDVGNLADRVNTLETQTVPMIAANARTDAHIAAFNATLTAMDRLNARMDAMTSQIANINGQLAATVSQMQSTFEQSESRMTASSSTAIAAQDRLITQLQTAINSTRDEVNNFSSDHFYIQWGSHQCTSIGSNNVRVEKLYEGWAYGTRHNYNGGGGKIQCLKNQANNMNGGVQASGTSADMIYPIRTDHTSYTQNRIPNSRNIPCSRCVARKTCYLETSVATCSAPGYKRAYSGFLMGGHESHSGNNDRICVDENRDSDFRYFNNWGPYLYPTIEDASLLSRQGRYVVACHMCCKE